MPPSKPSRHDILSEVELLGPLGKSTLALRFRGPFEGKTVIWDATFCTLSSCSSSPATRQNFIKIGDAGTNGMALTVGLDVPAFDAPTVRKTIMMIRQYKRLARGRHQFGTTHEEERG